MHSQSEWALFYKVLTTRNTSLLQRAAEYIPAHAYAAALVNPFWQGAIKRIVLLAVYSATEQKPERQRRVFLHGALVVAVTPSVIKDLVEHAEKSCGPHLVSVLLVEWTASSARSINSLAPLGSTSDPA